MTHITETLIASALVGFFVWLWTTYNRTQHHSALIREQGKDIMELQGITKLLEARLRVQEDNSLLINQKMERLPIIDHKLDELLLVHHLEAPRRITERQEELLP